MLKTYKNPPASDWSSILARPVMNAAALNDRVKEIIREVREDGDDALIRFASKFDGVSLTEVRVTAQEIHDAESQVPDALKSAIKQAISNIRKFHEAQLMREPVINTMPGVTCWRESRPIGKVGFYIPGGTAPLFSTVLMLAIPASVAGCREIVLCTPPRKDGSVHPAILYAAQLTGVSTIIKSGGAQAVAAMAYGTASVPSVFKIFGPGNQYVTAAKQQVSLDGIAIDMPAGPSEVAVIADETADPSFVAIDLLSQAEHGHDSQVVLITTSEKIAEKVSTEAARLLGELPRGEYMRSSLENSKAIIVSDLSEAARVSNTYCPEHLILAVKNPGELSKMIQNAGSIFLGHYTPESAGDYASGTNHTLPTNGAAAAYSGVSVDSFVKKITFQEITREGLTVLGPVVETMAEAEELMAHKMAVSIRLNK